MAANKLIVLTGATGFVGFRTLVFALKAGYNVRILVRSASKVDKILNSPSIKALKLSEERLSYLVIPDFTVAGAYDEAVKGATYVIHCASPIPVFGGNAPTPDQCGKFFVETARKATVELLESIRKAGSVKRVVITSSIAAIIPVTYLIGQGDKNKIFDADTRIPVQQGPYNDQIQAYFASKAAALNDSEAWVKENKPDFDIINILPGWIFGREELNTTADDFNSGSNGVLLGLLKGSQSDSLQVPNSVFIDDVAQMHVGALDPKIKGNQAFLATCPESAAWEDSIKIVEKNFPEALTDGRLKATGKQPTTFVNMDSKKSEEAFGIQFAGYEHQINSVVSQYLEVTA